MGIMIRIRLSVSIRVFDGIRVRERDVMRKIMEEFDDDGEGYIMEEDD